MSYGLIRVNVQESFVGPEGNAVASAVICIKVQGHYRWFIPDLFG